jgi:hypothetical protein
VAYIGTAPVVGQYRKLDTISGSFNGSTVTFNLTVSGAAVSAGTAQQLLISLGGVIQNPNTDYTVSTNTITFTTAPAAGLTFFGILMGDTLNIGTPSDGTITRAKLANDFTGATGASGSDDQVFYLNKKTVTASYTIPANYNAGTFGPCTINTGVTVTIPTGSSWVII